MEDTEREKTEIENTEREDTEGKDTEKEELKKLLENGHVRKIRTVSRDHDFFFGELFTIAQCDVDFCTLLGLDDNLCFHSVAVKTFTLNGYKILAGRNFGDTDTLSTVSGKNLVNDAGASAIKTVENDQDGVLAGSGDLLKLETNGAGTDQCLADNSTASGRRDRSGIRLDAHVAEQSEKIER